MGGFLGIEVQLSAIIEAMNEDWDASLTSNFSLTGLNQLIYLMTIVVLPNTRIADLRVDWNEVHQSAEKITNSLSKGQE